MAYHVTKQKTILAYNIKDDEICMHGGQIV